MARAPATTLPWVERLAARYGAWLALAAGAACSLAFAPAGLYPLAVLCPALLMMLWEGRRPGAAASIGFAYACGLFLAGTYWIYIAVHEVGKAPAWLAVFLLLGLVAIMAAYFALLGALAAWLVPRGGALRWLAFLPAGWTLVEWLRGWLFSGFPWLALGYAHIESPLAGLAPVAGIHAVTFASALTAGALVALVQGSARERVAAAIVVAAVWSAAAAVGGRAWTTPSGPPIDVAIVQAAVPQDDKWADENRDRILALYRDMTRPVLGRRLIVWPEASIPVLAHQAGPYLAAMWDEAQRAGSDLVLGLLRYDFETGHYYNGVLALSGGEAGWYYKRRLVPFGEFFPVPDVVRRWMRLMNLAYTDMTPGADDQPALSAAGVKVGVTVCYEDAYGADQLAVLREADLLINVTNNAWFGDSTAPHQQLQMARFRALEAGRYLVRATSNGITGIIGPDGSVVARAPQFVPDVLLGEARPFTGLTPYARTGNAPVLTLAALLLVVAASEAAARRGGRRASR